MVESHPSCDCRGRSRVLGSNFRKVNGNVVVSLPLPFGLVDNVALTFASVDSINASCWKIFKTEKERNKRKEKKRKERKRKEKKRKEKKRKEKKRKEKKRKEKKKKRKQLVSSLSQNKN